QARGAPCDEGAPQGGGGGSPGRGGDGLPAGSGGGRGTVTAAGACGVRATAWPPGASRVWSPSCARPWTRPTTMRTSTTGWPGRGGLPRPSTPPAHPQGSLGLPQGASPTPRPSSNPSCRPWGPAPRRGRLRGPAWPSPLSWSCSAWTWWSRRALTRDHAGVPSQVSVCLWTRAQTRQPWCVTGSLWSWTCAIRAHLAPVLTWPWTCSTSPNRSRWRLGRGGRPKWRTPPAAGRPCVSCWTCTKACPPPRPWQTGSR
ncbi:unnamed protein product, partial [Ixodes persulcatus]